MLGPTGSGKTALGIALANALHGEVLGCDALQVYRRFNIATAKPSSRERSQAVHHLIDFVEPDLHFSVADYVREADRVITRLQKRGMTPVIVGGSGMYLRALLRGLIEAPAGNQEVRDRLQRVARHRGMEFLHRWLARRDPESADRIAVSDSQRIVRALEISLLDKSRWSERLAEQGTWQKDEERYPSLKIGLRLEPERLRERLDRRAESFFRSGLIDEVATLLAEGVPRTANAFKAIGYREVIEGTSCGRSREEMLALVQRNSRRYAKRQRTWFRRERDVHWLDASQSIATLCATVLQMWESR